MNSRQYLSLCEMQTGNVEMTDSHSEFLCLEELSRRNGGKEKRCMETVNHSRAAA